MSGTITFLTINIIGGIAVLGGYAVCLYFFPDQRETLWGGVQNGPVSYTHLRAHET